MKIILDNLYNDITIVDDIKLKLTAFDAFTTSRGLGNLNAFDTFVYTVYTARYPERPSKPICNKITTSDEAIEYAEKLKVYELQYKEYENELHYYRIEEDKRSTLLYFAIQFYADFHTIVPEKYRAKVWSKAYQDGHSGGYYDILNHLIELVEIFE